MSQDIKFYIHKSQSANALGKLILSLDTEGIYIHTNDTTHAKKISDNLWAYPDRFIPNSLDPQSPQPVILIGYGDIPNDRLLIINASNTFVTPTHIEWISEDIEAGKTRYRQWTKQGAHPTITNV